MLQLGNSASIILHSTKRGEVTFMVLADYSKAFDTVKFKAILMKMHEMGFSKKFLYWVFDYLCNRRQFVQIDDKPSEMCKVEFGVPQGTILGPIFFNLYVADLHKTVQCSCYQYADDTTFYQHTKVANLHYCATEVNKAINRLENYSTNINLDKTKWNLFSTRKVQQVHGLHASSVQISFNGRTLERCTKQKLLGVEFEEHLVWNEHITPLIASCYSALPTVKRLRNLAPYHVRKMLMDAYFIKIRLFVHSIPSFTVMSIETPATSAKRACRFCLWPVCQRNRLPDFRMAASERKTRPTSP